jgi:hypothetical protein
MTEFVRPIQGQDFDDSAQAGPATSSMNELPQVASARSDDEPLPELAGG